MADNLIEIFLEEKAGKQIFDSLPIAVFVTDTEGHLKYYNSAAVKISGRKPELNTDRWFANWNFFDTDGTPMPQEENTFSLFLNNQKNNSGRMFIAERPDGKRIWIKAYFSLLHDETGETIGGINLLADNTEQKENEEQLRQNEKELTNFFDNAAVGLHQTRSDGIIERANQAILDMLGYSREEFIGSQDRKSVV